MTKKDQNINQQNALYVQTIRGGCLTNVCIGKPCKSSNMFKNMAASTLKTKVDIE